LLKGRLVPPGIGRPHDGETSGYHAQGEGWVRVGQRARHRPTIWHTRGGVLRTFATSVPGDLIG
jgi:hypothetical protein